MRKFFVLIASLIMLALAIPSVFATQPENPGADKIEICHATGNGGYVIVDVDKDAWDEHTSAHSDHEDDVPANDGLCPDDGGDDDDDDNDDGGDDDHKIEICHATGNGGYVIVDVDKDAWDEHTSAHSDHEDDVEAVEGACPDDGGNDGGDPNRPRTVSLSVAEQWVPTLDQVTVWSNLPGNEYDRTVAWLYMGELVYADKNGNGRMDEGELILTTIEHRDRFNRAIGQIELDVDMSRLVLSSNDGIDPDNFTAINGLVYLATGQIVPVGVFIETRDEHCQSEDFGSGAVCGTSVNLLTGEKWANGVQVR